MKNIMIKNTLIKLLNGGILSGSKAVERTLTRNTLF
jgi:hypothetical protein